MASTASDLLKLELQTDGENDSTWGQLANILFERVEQAIGGVTAIALVASDYTLDDTQFVKGSGTTAESHRALLACTGTLTASVNVIVPARTKIYYVKNNTSGAFSVTVKTPSGSGTAITQGGVGIVFCDGTNVETLSVGYTAAEAAKLVGIETSADVTDATNVAAAGAAMLGSDGAFTVALSTTGAFTSLGIDDNATGERLQLSDIDMLLGDGTTAGEIFGIGMRGVSTGRLDLFGGQSNTDGANLLLFGSTHATQAGDFEFRDGVTTKLLWDSSVGNLTIGGTFISTGMDDNATGERLQLADTLLTLGVDDTSTYSIGKAGATGSIVIGGDTDANIGANLKMFGGSHAAAPSEWQFKQGSTIRVKIDDTTAGGDISLNDNAAGVAVTVAGATGITTFAKQLNLKSFTVATVPSAAVNGGFIYVSDETGGATPAFSDGTNWRRTSDRTIVA